MVSDPQRKNQLFNPWCIISLHTNFGCELVGRGRGACSVTGDERCCGDCLPDGNRQKITGNARGNVKYLTAVAFDEELLTFSEDIAI